MQRNETTEPDELPPELQAKIDALLGALLGALPPSEREFVQRYLEAVGTDHPLLPNALEGLLPESAEPGNEECFFSLALPEEGLQRAFDEIVVALVRVRRRLMAAASKTGASAPHQTTDVRDEPIRITLGASRFGERTVVLPRSSQEPNDYIVLPSEGADVSLLHEAVRCILDLRQGSTRATRAPIIIRRSDTPERLPESWVRRLDGILAQLRSTPAEEHQSLGLVAVVELDILHPRRQSPEG